MDPFTIAAGIMAVIGGTTSILGGLSAKKDAKKQGKLEAAQEQIVTQAKVVDLQAEERAMRGQTIAGAAGGGVKVDMGSPMDVLAEQASVFAREILTVKQAGATRAANANTRGQMVGKQAAYQGFTQGANSLSNAFSLFASI